MTRNLRQDNFLASFLMLFQNNNFFTLLQNVIMKYLINFNKKNILSFFANKFVCKYYHLFIKKKNICQMLKNVIHNIV